MRFFPARIHKQTADLPGCLPARSACQLRSRFPPEPLHRKHRWLAQLVEPSEPSSERPVTCLDASPFARNPPPKFAACRAREPKVATMGPAGPAGQGSYLGRGPAGERGRVLLELRPPSSSLEGEPWPDGGGAKGEGRAGRGRAGVEAGGGKRGWSCSSSSAKSEPTRLRFVAFERVMGGACGRGVCCCVV